MNVPAYLPIAPARPPEPARRRDRREASATTTGAAAGAVDRVEVSGHAVGPERLEATLFPGHDPRPALAAQFIKIHRRAFR